MWKIILSLILGAALANNILAQSIIEIKSESFVVDDTGPFPVHYMVVSVKVNIPSDGYQLEVYMEPETSFGEVLVPNVNGPGVHPELQTNTFIPPVGYTAVRVLKLPQTGITFSLDEKLPVNVNPLSRNGNVATLTNIQYLVQPSIASFQGGYLVPSQTGSAILTVSGTNKDGQIITADPLPFEVTIGQALTSADVIRYCRICAVPRHYTIQPTQPNFIVTGQLSMTKYLWRAVVRDKETKLSVDQKTFFFEVPN